MVLGIVLLAAPPAEAAPLTWGAPAEVDRFSPFGISGFVEGISCVGDTLCVGVGTLESTPVVFTSSNPAADTPTWSRPHSLGNALGLEAVSCPSASFCAAVDATGLVLTTTAPAADPPVWKSTQLPFAPNVAFSGWMLHISCPTASFCAATDQRGDVYVSNDPGAASPTWTRTADPLFAGSIAGISCASSTLCVAIHEGNVRVSTNPGAASPVWSAAVDLTPVDQRLRAVSCPTTAFCMIASEGGNAYRSLDPTAAAPQWAHITTFGDFAAQTLDCPTPDMCTATSSGSAITSTNPGAATPVWRSRPLARSTDSLSCGTTSFCLATDINGPFAFSVRDAAQPSPSPNWRNLGHIIGMTPLIASDCVDETLCLIGDRGGRILSTPDPTSPAPAWRMTQIPGAARITGVDCASPTVCVAVSSNSRTAVTHDPRAATPPWVTTFSPVNFADLACPTADRCVAISPTDDSAVLSGVSKIGTIDDPAPVWSNVTTVDGASGLTSLSCPTATHCAAVDVTYNVLTTTDVAAADPVWQKVTTPPGGGNGFSDVSCPSVDLCVAVDESSGKSVRSTNPFAASPVWSEAVASVGTRLSCPAATFCLAGMEGAVRVATDLAPAVPAWTAPVPAGDERELVTTIACANDRLCLLGDYAGQVTFGVAVPQSLGAPTVSGEAIVGSALTAAGGSWTGVPAVSLQWERCGDSCTAIDGATAAAYTVTAADVGHTLRVTERAVNAGGAATASSTATGVVPPPPGVTPPPVPVVPTPAPPSPVTAAMIRSALQKALAGRLTFSFTAPTAGTLVVRWYSIKTRRKKSVLLATGRRRFTAPAVGKVKMKLTKKGKRILRKGKRVKIRAKATYTPLGGKGVTVTRKRTVKR